MQNQPTGKMLKQIIYFSRAAINFDAQKLLELMEKARKYNSENGITGILLYGDEVFVQCIEGGEDEVTTLYEKIKTDPRHDQITTLSEVSTPTRSFSEWLMGCVEINDEEALKLSTARWEEMNQEKNSSGNQSDGFNMMKTLWQMKKHKNITREAQNFDSLN